MVEQRIPSKRECWQERVVGAIVVSDLPTKTHTLSKFIEPDLPSKTRTRQKKSFMQAPRGLILYSQ